MLKTKELLKALSKARARFVVIGGMAAVAQGSSYVTADLDLCYARDLENLERLSEALSPFRPRPRGMSSDLPFVLDARTLRSGTNFTLSTSVGDVDLLGEVEGLGDFKEVLAGSEELELFGYKIHVLGLEGLIKSKQAVGRPKDLQILPELKGLLALQKRQDTDS